SPAWDSDRNRTLADLLHTTVDSLPHFVPNVPRVVVDEARVAAQGIRKLESKRLTLYTDMPSEPAVDELPAVFDQAFPQLCEYFGVDPAKHANWRMTGFLMREKALFVRTGLLPESLPPFPHGYARNDELWLYDQPSDYYRRHLLIHEGVHGFMNTLLGACGPPWYMEGMAEMLATHRWRDGTLTLNHMPANREETPHWGRIRIVKEAFEDQKALTLDKIIDYPPSAFTENAAYAWSWAAAALLDRHPRYRERFRPLYAHVLKPNFNDLFHQSLGNDWPLLSEDWQVFIAGMEYGYDVARAAIERKPGSPLPSGGATIAIQAGRGWQSTGLLLEANRRYRLTASGRYQVAKGPEPWWCEPGGVSIRYYQGKPLGLLLAAVRPDHQPAGLLSPLMRPITVGLGATLTPSQTGTLMLKINHSAAELAHCAGELSIRVEVESEAN
ncbi:MAG: hypothetical protein U1E05_26195, partial [Patescibacteria group bacterium]|nr:hypothetical protein [Patescibacteria group bacterium]